MPSSNAVKEKKKKNQRLLLYYVQSPNQTSRQQKVW